MASSKVMPSRSTPNQDLPRQQSPPRANNLRSDHSRGFGSMNIDDILSNIYSGSESFALENGGGSDCGGGGYGNGSKTVEEVWRDIVGGGAGGEASGEPAMTLEDFLAKAGAMNEEDVMAPPPPPPQTGSFGMSPAAGYPAVQFSPAVCVQNGMAGGGFGVDFGNGMVGVSGCVAGSGRGKRRAAVEDVPLDKATQQRQKRMIKNRESAARSRQRKQAYTVELEALVAQLEEENARLLKEEVEVNQERYKQLMENIIPVVEKRRPHKALRRLNSMEW